MQLITLCSFGNDSPETASTQKLPHTYYCIQFQDLSQREAISTLTHSAPKLFRRLLSLREIVSGSTLWKVKCS
jgi:hypothetical protein